MISNLSRWLYNRRVRKRLAAAHKRLLNYRIGANAAAKVEEEIPDVYGYNDPVPPRLFLRLKTAGTIEFELLRAIGYFIATLLICSFFYFFFVMRYQLPPNNTGVLVGLIMVAVLLCCTQLAFCRCLVLLTLSELFSSKGRWLILSTVTALAVGGPLINIAKNGEKLGQTGICIQELVKQDAKELLIQYKGFLTEKFKPLTEAIEKMEKIIKGLFRFWWFMSQGLIMAVKSIYHTFKWLGEVLGHCNRDTLNPIAMCRRRIDQKVNSCWDEAGWKAFLCPGMYLVKPFCFMAGMLKTLCQLPARVRDWFMENIANRILAAIDPLIEEFYFQTEFSFQKEMKTTHELSFNHTMLELLQEIRGTVDLFQIYMELVAVLFAMISGFFLIQAVYGAIRYQCGYRTLPTFDNNFITKELEELDRIRSQSGHETILPLTFIESQQYPSAWTLGFRPNEKPRFFIEAMFVASNAIVPTIILALDYAVYVTMGSMINFFRENATEPNLPGYFSIHTEGSGILADAYNSLINSLSPVWGNFNAAGRWKICLLRPDVPDFDTYLLIAGLLLLALITILFEIYIHRTRHFICAQFFPKAESMRVRSLYDFIRTSRGSMRIQLIEEFQRFRQAAQNRDYRGAGETAAGVDWTVVRNFGLHNWRSQFPIANRILNVVGFKQQTCERCHELVYGGDPGQIKLCPNHECRKLYCANCFEVVKIRCIACGLKMSELDLSHDYYIDSSDESSEDEDDEDGEEGIEEDEDDEDEDEENEVP